MKKIGITKQMLKKYYFVLGIALVLSLFCIVQFIRPNVTYEYYGESFFSAESGPMEEVVLYENISLPAGVYAVQLYYESEADMQNVCSIYDASVYPGALQTNYEHLYTALHGTDYIMWLFESTDALEVRMDYRGIGRLYTGDLKIVETDYLWTMLLSVTWMAAIACISVFYMRDYDHLVGLGTTNKTIVLGIVTIILLASMPYLLGATISGADLGYHLLRIEGVKDGILSGQFPVRLEPEWLFGHGYANGIFYCNTFLTIPAIFRLLGFGLTTSYNAFAIIVNIATAIISYLCFSRIFKDKYIGLLCSGLYTLSIFRIYKFVITSALGEGTAVTFMPLVLYGLYRIFTEDVNDKQYKTTWIPVAIGYAGLIQCHVLSCEITALLTIIICVICIKKIFVWNTFRELAKGALSALLMSCWYLVPFLDYYMTEDVHIRHVSARTIQERGLNVAQLIFHYWKLGENALTGESGMYHSHALGVGFVLFLAFVVVTGMWFFGKWKGMPKNITLLSKISAFFAGMLMLMSLNVFPWDKIQRMNSLFASLVSSLQFPNRFLGWGTVFLVTLSGCILMYGKSKQNKMVYYMGVVCILWGITTSGVYLLDYVGRDHSHLYLYNEEVFQSGYISGGEYIIEGTNASILTHSTYSASQGVSVEEYEKGALEAWATCTGVSGAEGYLEFPLLHYKGYRAYGPEGELECIKGTNNLVRVNLPQGFQGEIHVKFVSPWYWRLAEGITYAWWIGILAYVEWKWVTKRRRRNNERVC